MRKLNKTLCFLCLGSTCLLAESIFSLSSCASNTQPSEADLFIIENGILKGFKDTTTVDNIKACLKNDTLCFPNNVVSVDENAFYRNSRTTIPDCVKEIDFSQSPTLTTIGPNAFREAPITKLVIPSNITTINRSAFSMSKITMLNFLPSLNQNSPLFIQELAFYNCDSLININFGIRTYNIEESVFAKLSNLKNIDFSSFDLPPDWRADNIFLDSGANDSILTIKNDLYFEKWEEFKIRLRVSPNTKIFCATKIYDYELINDQYVLKGFSSQISEKQIVDIFNNTLVIPNIINVINDNAFVKDDNTTTIPKEIEILDLQNNLNLLSIKSSAFKYSPFKEITILDSLGLIENNAFFGSNVNKLIFNDQSSIHNNNIHLESSSFESCENLESIILTNSNKKIDKNAFKSLPNLRVVDLMALNKDFIFTDWDKEIFADNEKNSCKILVHSGIEIKNFTSNYFSKTGLVFSQNNWFFLEKEKLFNINESNFLTGFNENFTPAEIQTIIGGKTLTIPNNVVKIAENAFFKNKVTTIPNTVEELKFESDSHCVTIEPFAFAESPFIKIEIPSSVKIIKPHSFIDMPSLIEIDLTQINFDSSYVWESNSFKTPKISNGNIYLKNHSSHNEEFAKNFFVDKNGFVVGPDNWKIVPMFITIDELFQLSTEHTQTGETNVILEGFSSYFLNSDENSRRRFLSKLFDSDQKLIIPNFVNVVKKDAFYSTNPTAQSKVEKLPSFIREIHFESQSKCHTIQSRAFGYETAPTTYTHVYWICIPPSAKVIEENAFYNMSQLTIIHLHGLKTIPEAWSKVVIFNQHANSGFICYTKTQLDESEIENFVNAKNAKTPHPNPFVFSLSGWITNPE